MSTVHDFTINQSAAMIETMQAHWQECDPDFKAALPYLMEFMAEIAREYPPTLWPQLLDMNYRAVKMVLQGFTELSKATDGQRLSSLLH